MSLYTSFYKQSLIILIMFIFIMCNYKLYNCVINFLNGYIRNYKHRNEDDNSAGMHSVIRFIELFP